MYSLLFVDKAKVASIEPVAFLRGWTAVEIAAHHARTLDPDATNLLRTERGTIATNFDREAAEWTSDAGKLHPFRVWFAASSRQAVAAEVDGCEYGLGVTKGDGQSRLAEPIDWSEPSRAGRRAQSARRRPAWSRARLLQRH